MKTLLARFFLTLFSLSLLQVSLVHAQLPLATGPLQGTMSGTALYQGSSIEMNLSFYDNPDPNSQGQCPLWSYISTLYGAQWLCSYVEINALTRQIRYVANGDGVSLDAFLTSQGLEGNIVTMTCDAQSCQNGQGTFVVATPISTASFN